MVDSSCDKWIYEFSEQRYVLGRPGKHPIICFGVNPSTAMPGEEHLDKTMKTIASVIKEHSKYTGYIMLNLYPQRATDPSDLHKADSPLVKAFIEENLHYIEKVISEYDAPLWACWGSLIEKRSYLKDSLYQIADIADRYKRKWVTIGKITDKGHPHHPLFNRLEEDEEFRDFDMSVYIKTLKGVKTEKRTGGIMRGELTDEEVARFKAAVNAPAEKIYSEDEMEIWPDDADDDEVQEILETYGK